MVVTFTLSVKLIKMMSHNWLLWGKGKKKTSWNYVLLHRKKYIHFFGHPNEGYAVLVIHVDFNEKKICFNMFSEYPPLSATHMKRSNLQSRGSDFLLLDPSEPFQSPPAVECVFDSSLSRVPDVSPQTLALSIFRSSGLQVFISAPFHV